MFGALINRFISHPSQLRDGESMLLTTTEFNREIARERIRATRRSIPFCIVDISLTGRKRIGVRRKNLIRLLHRNVRLTDQKADLGGNRFAVLLVDTPEMGGRSFLDRLSGLCDSRQIDAHLSLRVHDPEGFDPDEDQHLPTGSGKRRGDDTYESKWIRLDRQASEGSALMVQTEPAPCKPAPPVMRQRNSTALVSETCVTSEDALVERPLGGRIVKRSVDVFGASVGLVMTSPLLVCAAVAVKMTSPGPAFFRQTREGRGGKPFLIYKMRTMEVDAESKQAGLRESSHRDGPAFKIKHDPRVTKIGSFLRKTCIDELPQLINVLRGEMSLVGPRPLPWHESRACNHWHRRRLDVPPGMTCYWQIDKAAAETFDDWMRMDLRYVDRQGLWRDLGLIARTFVVPMTGRGSE